MAAYCRFLSGRFMRLLLLPLLFLSLHSAYATGFNQKDTLTNTRYVETEADKARLTFTESDEALPAFPPENTRWQALYVNPSFSKHALVALDIIYLAPDQTVRYILNVRSTQGIDNLSVEALYCSPTTLQPTKSSYKTYAYGDPINRRWIVARNAQWKEMGSILNSADPVRGVLYKAWCVDGLPQTQAGLVQRVQELGGRVPESGKQVRHK